MTKLVRVLLALLVTACVADDAAPVEIVKSNLQRATAPSGAHVAELGAGNRAFAFELFHALRERSPTTNLVVSPYSVSTALAMLYAGARGQTAAELGAALQFKLEQPQLHEAFNAVDLALAARGKAGAVRLNVANAVWMQHELPVAPDFLDTLAVNYGAGVAQTDFEKDPRGARIAINRWVSQQTEGLIHEVMPESAITEKTALVLTNTVYFNAGWLHPFTQSNYHFMFTKLDGTEVSVPFMYEEDRSYEYVEGEDFQAIALPYVGDALRLIVILPDYYSHAKVEDAVSGRWFDALSWSMQRVELSLPKFEYAFNSSLVDALAALGVQVAFSEGADLSGMSSAHLRVEAVIHEARIKVDERGTVAAAATAVSTEYVSRDVDVRRMQIDRPFLFAIRDEPTGQLLFLGRVLDPTQQ